jgi:hypothetical protein
MQPSLTAVLHRMTTHARSVARPQISRFPVANSLVTTSLLEPFRYAYGLRSMRRKVISRLPSAPSRGALLVSTSPDAVRLSNKLEDAR